MEEIFKEIKGYPNYEISNHGRVKSLKFGKERILKAGVSSSGYLGVVLHKNNKGKTFNVHQLVAMTFLGHEPDGYEIIVDHVNNDKLSNHVSNLQLITHRHNTTKDKKGGTSSKYTGVCWAKHVNKWVSHIWTNGKLINLGYFKCELAAHSQYQKALENLDKFKNPKQFRELLIK